MKRQQKVFVFFFLLSSLSSIIQLHELFPDVVESPPSDFSARDMIQQAAIAGAFMLIYRYMNRLNFEDPRVVQLSRTIFAMYMIITQLINMLLKRSIDRMEEGDIELDTSAGIDMPQSVPEFIGKFRFCNFFPITIGLSS